MCRVEFVRIRLPVRKSRCHQELKSNKCFITPWDGGAETEVHFDKKLDQKIQDKWYWGCLCYVYLNGAPVAKEVN